MHTILSDDAFLEKKEKDKEYIRTIKGLGESLEHMIRQNNAIDIYEVCVANGSCKTIYKSRYYVTCSARKIPAICYEVFATT